MSTTHELSSDPGLDVSKNHLMTLLERIASEVRLSGSAEERRAFEYVQSELESYGIETKLTFDEAFISLPGKATLAIGQQTFPCITHSMSASTGSGGLDAELVYVKDTSLLSTANVKDKIVLLEGIANPSVVNAAEEAGVGGAIFINGPITHEMIVSTVWGSPTPETVQDLPSIPVVSITDKEGHAIKTILQANAPVEVHLETVIDTGWRKIPTLVAEIKGYEDPDKFVLFSGHIDSWHYGAMDNGTANATMVEVARVLTKHKARLRRSVRLAFWSGHSHGRYAGSTLYCDKNWEDLHDNCALYIYIDSVGGQGATVLAESEYMDETRDFLRSIIESNVDEKFLGKRFVRNGDQSFWGPGIPSVLMGLSEQPINDDPSEKTIRDLFAGEKGSGYGWWWHTTEDTIDKISPENLERDCRVYLQTVLTASEVPILPIKPLHAIENLAEQLHMLASNVENGLECGVMLNRVETLRGLGKRFAALQEADYESVVQRKRLNDEIMRLSRILVQLGYVEGNPHDHDPASSQPAIPLLSPLYELGGATPGTPTFYQLRTQARRRINKVNNLLRQGIVSLNQFFDVFDK